MPQSERRGMSEIMKLPMFFDMLLEIVILFLMLQMGMLYQQTATFVIKIIIPCFLHQSVSFHYRKKYNSFLYAFCMAKLTGRQTPCLPLSIDPSSDP